MPLFNFLIKMKFSQMETCVKYFYLNIPQEKIFDSTAIISTLYQVIYIIT